MIKTDTVKEVKDLQRKDNYDNHSFIVTMNNGDSGFMNSKENPSSYFVVGRSVEYDFEEKQKRDNSGTYTTIKKPKKEFTPGGGGVSKWQPKDAKAYKADAITMCLSYAYRAAEVFADDPSKLEPADIKKWFEAFVGYAHAEIDKLFTP